MDVESMFLVNSVKHRRKFKFDSINGVTPEANNLEIFSDDFEFSTKISLNNFKKQYYDYVVEKRIELEDIAHGIIQHSLLYFVSDNVPVIRIFNDNQKDDAIILNDLFKEIIKFDKEPKVVKIGTIKTPFTLNYLRNYKNKSHSFHLCANQREVGNKINCSNYIPSFVPPLQDSKGKEYYISVYITGKFLDEKANMQRNRFNLPTKSDDKNQFDEVSLDELLEETSNDVQLQYKDFIVAAEKVKSERITNYILNPKNPRLAYKHLLSVENVFNDIPANISDERLESELHKKTFQLEQKRSKVFEKAFSKKKYDKEEFGTVVMNILKEEAAFSIGKLADYVIRRKAIINLFKKYLEWRDNENYMLEEDLHNIIFTMGAETSNMPCEFHNLWLLDERLTFHSYTTSDKQLRTDKHIDSDSQRETDLLIYDFPWAFSDNQDSINSLVVFEFKRPGRDMNTSKDKKLESQVELYFEKLMESKAKSDKGRYLKIQENTPKFGYIICDLHNELIDYNTKHNYFKKTPYNTLYKINESLNMYFEVMDYQTLIDFAEKRHNAFFKALGIDNL